MAEPLAGSGRGGAGNYWSKKYLKEAAITEPVEDIEAQNTDPNLLTRITTGHLTLTDYSKIGRGGAGNVVYTPESSASASELKRATAARLVNQAAGSGKKGSQMYQRHGGRGGAGNWRGDLEEEETKREEEEERVRREVETRVNEEVDMNLKPPGAAYRGPGS